MPPSKKDETLNKAQILNKLIMELHGFDEKYILELNQEGLTDTELKARANELEVPYTRWIKKVLDTFTIAQMTKMAEVAETEGQIAYMRGAISAFTIIKQWFESQQSLSKARFQKDE